MEHFRADGTKRPCPHCSGAVGRDYGWRCHHRSVASTPTRDSAEYWASRHQPADHTPSGLYLHGPDDTNATLYEMMTDSVANEVVFVNEDAGKRLYEQQEMANRLKVIDFLALHPHLWGLVKLRMKLARTPRKRVEEIREWLEAAQRKRKGLIEASKREALRLATR